jgi:hypothetical protein
MISSATKKDKMPNYGGKFIFWQFEERIFKKRVWEMQGSGFYSGDTPAFRAMAFCCTLAPGHFDTFAIHKSIGYLFSRLVQVTPCGLARDPQPGRGFFLFESFEIDEPDEFDLFWMKKDYHPILLWAAAWFIAARFSFTFNDAADSRPAPSVAFRSINYFMGIHNRYAL